MQQNLEASAKHGVDNLVYTFYDRGYSALNEGIQNLKNMSAALLVMRAAAGCDREEVQGYLSDRHPDPSAHEDGSWGGGGYGGFRACGHRGHGTGGF